MSPAVVTWPREETENGRWLVPGAVGGPLPNSRLGTLAKIEAGVRRLNDAEVVILAKALKVKVADLLEGFPDKQTLVVVRQGAS